MADSPPPLSCLEYSKRSIIYQEDLEAAPSTALDNQTLFPYFLRKPSEQIHPTEPFLQFVSPLLQEGQSGG